MPAPNTAAARLLAGSREPVLVATTANITLSGLQTIDGVLLVSGDRVLVKDQTDATENGIYTASSGIWYRAPDARNSRAISKGITVAVQSGDTYEFYIFVFETIDPDIGDDDISIISYLSLGSGGSSSNIITPTSVVFADSPFVPGGADTYLYVNSSGGAVVINLTAAILRGGAPLVIKDVGGVASTNNITINRNGAETIDGLTSLVINADYGGYRLNPRSGIGYTVSP